MISVHFECQQRVDSDWHVSACCSASVSNLNDVDAFSVWNVFEVCAIVVRKVVIDERKAIRKLCG